MQASPKDILKKFWGFGSFKGSQENSIQAILNGQDVLALMPTGGGKSICFQVPAMVQEGICIVVSPLVALIQNQVETLKQKGIKAIALTGGLSMQEVDQLLDNGVHGNYKFLYLSPERLLQPIVQERIQQMQVNLIAIDEAHCISEWGHDFRPAYLQCSILRELHPQIPLIALTATATQKVARDIISNLNMENMLVVKDSYARKNIQFLVQFTEDKLYQLVNLLHGKNESSIVYVRSRRETVTVSKMLETKGVNATFFHGGLSSFEKKEKLDAWLSGKKLTMVATNAFGMGVDKPDVRHVIHYQIPESIENYFQEAGRAGRDGKPAKAILFTNPNDIERAKKQFLGSLPDVSYVKKVYKKLNAFFQIAYAEGQNDSFGLHFKEFCESYDLHPTKTFSALKILSQNGVLSLSENFQEKATIQINAKKEELFQWLKKNNVEANILQVLLRTYGGLFDFETKINLSLLSKKTNESESKIDRVLKLLRKDGLADYSYIQNDLEVTFLQPREDDRTVNAIANTIALLNSTKKEKLQQMLAYVEAKDTCRTAVLLQYFGEKTDGNCENCDSCTKATSTSNTDLKLNILEVLRKGDKTSRELIQLIPDIEQQMVLNSIRELLEENRLTVKSNNKYGIA